MVNVNMILSCISSFHKLAIRPLAFHSIQLLHTTQINPAARKGTREKARKKKVKVVIEKIGFIPHNQRGKDKLNLALKDKHIDDSWKAISTDNVWVGKYYQWRVYSVLEAIECHKETHHPSMYNEPNAPLNVTIELNMQGEKKTRFIEQFQRMAIIPNKFEHGEERKILVLAKGEEILREASEAGAFLVGGTEVVRSIQSGDLKIHEFQFVLAHPNILPDMVSIRGLLKRKFPNPKNGTLGANLNEMVRQFLTGIQYKAVRDDHQLNYGKISTCIGTLNMDKSHLEENLVALLKDINAIRPKRAGKFITRTLLTSPPSGETLKIDPFVYIPEENIGSGKVEVDVENEDVEVEEEAEAKN